MTHNIVYIWGNVLPTGEVLEKYMIETIHDVIRLEDTLDSIGIDLIRIHPDGIILRYRSADSSLTEIEAQILKNSQNFTDFKTEIGFLIDEIKISIEKLEKQKTDAVYEEEIKEVGKEFYLLFDMLPEKIRKELKIYIKEN